jgi:hypothetical protein
MQTGILDPADVSAQSAWTRVSPGVGITSGFNVQVVKTEIFSRIDGGSLGDTSGYWTVNPANDLLCPWLSTIAPCFEQYVINSLSVEYVPECNYIATGTVTMAFLYDAADTTVPNTMTQLSQYEGAVTGSVRVPISCHFDVRRCQFKRYMVLSNSTYDPDRLSVPAYFAFALAGATPGTPLGQLRFRYSIDLCNTQFPERPLMLRSARVIFNPVAWPAIGNYNLSPQEIIIPAPNYHGWLTYAEDTGFMINGPDEVNIYIYALTTVDPYPWGANGSATQQTQPLNLRTSNSTPLMNMNDYVAEITPKVGTYSHASLFSDCRRPTGTAPEPWGFRFVIDGAVMATYAVGTMLTFMMHIAEAVN